MSANDFQRSMIMERLSENVTTKIDAFHKILQEKFVHINVLINNGRIYLDDDTDILNVDLKVVQKTFDTNTFGPIRVIQAMTPLLIKRKSARIVNVSSGLGSLSTLGPTHPSYILNTYYFPKWKNKNYQCLVCPDSLFK
jgi:short-subunit dehydrogenase involved in D-alanine esterification of teichoic acids